MAITHNAALRTALMVDLIAELNNNATPGSGACSFKIYDSTPTLLATITTAGGVRAVVGSSDAATFTLEPITSGANMEDTTVIAGTAATFTLGDGNASHSLSGTVGATGGSQDLILSSIVFAAGDAVRINSFTYTIMA